MTTQKTAANGDYINSIDLISINEQLPYYIYTKRGKQEEENEKEIGEHMAMKMYKK